MRQCRNDARRRARVGDCPCQTRFLIVCMAPAPVLRVVAIRHPAHSNVADSTMRRLPIGTDLTVQCASEIPSRALKLIAQVKSQREMKRAAETNLHLLMARMSRLLCSNILRNAAITAAMAADLRRGWPSGCGGSYIAQYDVCKCPYCG